MIKKIITSTRLLVIGVLSAIVCFGSLYVIANPENFIEISAVVDEIYLDKFESVRGSYFFVIRYNYEYKNKKYIDGDHHYFPARFYTADQSNSELQKYIFDQRKNYEVGSKVKIFIHPLRPNIGRFEPYKIIPAFVLFTVVIWFSFIFLFIFISIIIQIFKNWHSK